MAIAITEQTAVFFHSLLLGAVLGCFYDLFRITRIAFVIPALLVLVEDLLFFLFSSTWSQHTISPGLPVKCLPISSSIQGST